MLTRWKNHVDELRTGPVKRPGGPNGVARRHAGSFREAAGVARPVRQFYPVYARLYPAGSRRKHKKTGRLQDCETPGLRLEVCQLIRSAATPPLFRYHNSSFPFCAAVLQYEARFLPMHQHAGSDPASIPRSSRGTNYKFHRFIEIRMRNAS